MESTSAWATEPRLIFIAPDCFAYRRSCSRAPQQQVPALPEYILSYLVVFSPLNFPGEFCQVFIDMIGETVCKLQQVNKPRQRDQCYRRSLGLDCAAAKQQQQQRGYFRRRGSKMGKKGKGTKKEDKPKKEVPQTAASKTKAMQEARKTIY